MNLMCSTTRTSRACRRGFSLVEILVVISIILALLAMGVIGIQRLRDSSLNSQTRSLLAKLNAINAEYQTQTRQTINYTANDGDGSESSIREFYAKASQIPTCLTMLESIRGDGLVSVTDNTLIQDSWEMPIQYRSFTDANQRLPRYASPFFTSAGANTKLGDVRTTASAADQNDAKDNLYSFELK